MKCLQWFAGRHFVDQMSKAVDSNTLNALSTIAGTAHVTSYFPQHTTALFVTAMFRQCLDSAGG